MQSETDFYFDEWASLAKVDPETFEIRRRRAVDRFLKDSTSRQRMLGARLQREIDSERDRAGDPHEAFQVIARMMCQQLAFLGDGMADLNRDIKRVSRSNLLAERGLSLR